MRPSERVCLVHFACGFLILFTSLTNSLAIVGGSRVSNMHLYGVICLEGWSNILVAFSDAI